VVRKARSTLAAGSARAALEELDDYFARFPDARLRQEATVLRVEALLASGQREQAEALARPFLAENSAYASRLRQLLAK
jgi:outer membrane protein assembly factor BamD (BamD/ComL family)